MIRRLTALTLLCTAAPAAANDSTAELGTGGLILSRSDLISMESEDLSISKDQVTVDYVFRNRSDKDIETIVAFPMPDIEANPYWMPAIPRDGEDNFLGFEVNVDGREVEPQLEQKAFAVGIDISAELIAQGVPLYPYGEAALKALEKVPEAVAQDWIDRGIVVVDEFDDGSGMKSVRSPFWQLRSTFWWRATFPANEDVSVSHRYAPSLGSSAGLNFFVDGKLGGDGYEEYKYKYCLDQGFERAVAKAAKADPEGYPRLTESRISYILKTGGNWALGTIGKFRLTIDKGSPQNIVSFCANGVRKTGPTTFEVESTDCYPARDIDILILEPYSTDPSPGSAAPGARP